MLAFRNYFVVKVCLWENSSDHFKLFVYFNTIPILGVKMVLNKNAGVCKVTIMLYEMNLEYINM